MVLMDNLSGAIANLGYPVGCGVPPSPGHLKRAAETLFERYAKMIEMAHGVGIPAQQMPVPPVFPDLGPDWTPPNPAIEQMFRPAHPSLETLAREFEGAEHVNWTGQEVADYLRHKMASSLPSTQRDTVADSTGEKTGTHGASKEAGGHSRDGLTPVSSPSKHNQFNPQREYCGSYGPRRS